jgi:hypothetical protein
VFVDRESGRRLSAAEVRDSAGRDVVVREAAGGEVERSVDRSTVVERFAVTTRGDTLRGTAADSALAADRTVRMVEVRRVEVRGVEDRAPAFGPTNGGYATDRTVLVPVPAEGEIIVRYGPQRAPLAADPRDARDARTPAPARTVQREYRERDGRVVREYRESDGTVSREFTDDRGRPIREYRDVTGRVVREYVTPSTSSTETIVVPSYAPPAGQYQPAPAAPAAPAAAPAAPVAALTPATSPGTSPPGTPARPAGAPA